MKWGIIILLILGVIAAACAAMLVGTLSINSSASAKKDSSSNVEVATAKVSMPAMTVVTLDHIIKEEIPKDNLPEGRLLTPSQVIGKVLAVSVVEGQVLTASCFVTEGTGAHLASALPYGMRAVSVNLSSKSIPDELLLYPGCVVDVLVSFKLSSSDRNKGQAISTTMLRGIQVLAVEGNSVVSKPDAEGEVAAKARKSGSQVTVTLMVDPKQAEALQLAGDNGSISLAIRNPLDKKMVDMEATVLSQGRLANLGSVLTPAVFSENDLEEQLTLVEKSKESRNEKSKQMKQEESQKAQEESSSFFSLLKQSILSQGTQQQSQQDSSAEREIMERRVISDEEYRQYESRQYPRWGITVIRGSESTVEELDVQQNNPVNAVKTYK